MLTLLVLFLVLKYCLRQKRKSLRQDAAEGSSVVVPEERLELSRFLGGGF